MPPALNRRRVQPCPQRSPDKTLGVSGEIVRPENFVHALVHDLNNLLTPILSLTELVRIGLPHDDASVPLLSMIEQTTLRARNLVQRILTTGDGSPNVYKSVDLSELLRKSLPALAASMPSMIRLQHRIDPTPAIFGDADELHRVILNLTTNAVHAIGQQCGTISVSLSTETNQNSTDRDMVRLVVADTGSGMDDATRRRIFQPFFSTKEPGHGAGIGLTIVSTIVATHSGSIRVISQPGKGARFEIDLPSAGKRRIPSVT